MIKAQYELEIKFEFPNEDLDEYKLREFINYCVYNWKLEYFQGNMVHEPYVIGTFDDLDTAACCHNNITTRLEQLNCKVIP